MINKLKWTKKSRITIAVLSMVLATTSLILLLQMNQVAEASILTPIESPPETIFFEDFSGDLGQWTIVSGTWAIQNEECIGNNTGMDDASIFAGLTDWTDYILEVKWFFPTITNNPHHLGTKFRWNGNYLRTDTNANGYYIDYWLDKLRIVKTTNGMNTILNTKEWSPQTNVWYTVKIEVSGQTAVSIKVKIDDVQYLEYTDTAGPIHKSGKIGLWAFDKSDSVDDVQGHFDDVTIDSFSIPSSYRLDVRNGAREIVITCAWKGSGNITISSLTSPTKTYYESDMSLYDKTRVSMDGTITVFNIRRATVSITAPTSSETWTLYLDLIGITAYEVSVEII